MAARLLQQNWGTIVRQSLSQSTHLRLLSATPCLQRIDASKWGELPIVHVKATDNNTMCTVSDSHGKGREEGTLPCLAITLAVVDVA